MLIRRLFVLGAAASLVSGCVTVAAHNVATDEIQSWKVATIETVVAPDARIIWPKVEEPFVEKHLPRGAATTFVSDDSGREATKPGERPPVTSEIRQAGRAHFQRELNERARRYMEPIRGVLLGRRPVKVVTTVYGLDVPTMGRQIVNNLLFGSGTSGSQSKISLSTDIVDAKTGAVLLSYPKQFVSRQGGESLFALDASDPYSSDAAGGLLKQYHEQYFRWLLKA
jgi:hypothetical protein